MQRNERGFTLVEVTVILLVLVILSAILLPQLGGFNRMARYAKVREDVGVICAAMEYHGATEGAAMDAIAERIRANTQAVVDEVRAADVLPSQAAHALARRRIDAAMKLRRWSIY